MAPRRAALAYPLPGDHRPGRRPVGGHLPSAPASCQNRVKSAAVRITSQLGPPDQASSTTVAALVATVPALAPAAGRGGWHRRSRRAAGSRSRSEWVGRSLGRGSCGCRRGRVRRGGCGCRAGRRTAGPRAAVARLTGGAGRPGTGWRPSDPSCLPFGGFGRPSPCSPCAATSAQRRRRRATGGRGQAGHSGAATCSVDAGRR